MKLKLMLRGAGVGLTTLACALPLSALALGVGEYSLHSYLNQPLEMEVMLTDTEALDVEELCIGLAAPADFERVGVERQGLHSELQFDLQLMDDGTGLLKISTRQPVREPYLNFLVEYQWPSGRMLREYTVLLDPPSYASSFTPTTLTPARPAAAPQAPAAAAQPDAVAPSPTAAAAPTTAPASAPVATPATRSAAAQERYQVQARDTLWRIALDTRPNSAVSVQQTMVAIQQLNPDAFIRGNLNLVREGAVLRLPSEEEIRRITTRDANASVAEQERAWRAMSAPAAAARAPLDGTGSSTVTAPAPATSEGRVTLVAADEGTDGGAGSGDAQARGSDPAALENELAIRAENLDRLRRENDELRSRLGDLDEQLDTSGQLLQLRDAQIAQLQQALKQLQGDDTDPTLAPVVLSGTLDQSAAETAATDVSAAAPAATEAGTVPADEAVAAAPGAVAGGKPAAEQSVAADKEPAKPMPPRPPAPAPIAEPSVLDMLLENPMIPVGGGVALLLVLLLLARRRKQAAAAEPVVEEPATLAPVVGDVDAEPEAEAIEVTAVVPEMAPEPETDPLEEVDSFVAYGQYPQAVRHLRTAIAAAPTRLDLKKRLFDVLAESQDDAAFRQEATKLSGLNDELDEHISALRARVFAAPVAAADELDFDQDFSAAPVAQEPASELDFKFDLGGDSSHNLDSNAAEPALIMDLEDEQFDLDAPSFDLPASDATLNTEVSLSLDDIPEALELDSDLSLDDDLSLDFSLDVPVARAEEVAPALDVAPDDALTDLSDEDFALELDDEPAAAEAAPAPEVVAAAPANTDDEFDFLADADENATKLDLARAYLDMGDRDGARDILGEVVEEGSDAQQQEARTLLAQLD
ncbi:FimV/HubP family polar landmark protein [Isoalcanivorax beigongshangi]|uniref:FimV/HubP family polar landmark protein n=1 Tax=Isoalcanivorax beigongshangi TaxID=3238810 RepID=A0ABV4AK69_9GAMM